MTKGRIISTLILVTIAICSGLKEIYISRNGQDHPLCGETTYNACGTMYYVSNLVNSNYLNQSVQINVIDGQNHTQIINYYTNGTDDSHPCLPIAFNETIDVVISFNKTHINDMNDWFPNDICNNETSNTDYNNTYMFEGGNSLVLDHLIINNYVSMDNDNFFGFIKNMHLGGLTCNHCVFKDIISESNIPMIEFLWHIDLFNISINDVEIYDRFIYSDWRIDETYDDHASKRVHSMRQIKCVDSIFHQPFLETKATYGYGLFLAMEDSEFVNISSENDIIYDSSAGANISFSNIKINIATGTVFTSKHVVESYVYFRNIKIVVSELNTDFYGKLFEFDASDIVHMENIDIEYLYDLESSCSYDDIWYSDLLNQTCYYMECTNPVGLIDNYGHVTMKEVYLNINISDDTIRSFQEIVAPEHKFLCLEYLFHEGFPSFIQNHLQLNITDFYIQETTARYLFVNEGSLTIHRMIQRDTANLNPNALHSRNIIFQLGSTDEPTLHVYDSKFPIAEVHFAMRTGDSLIYNSLFQMALNPIFVADGSLTVENCNFSHNGRFHNTFERLNFDVSNTHEIQCREMNYIHISNSYISDFYPTGFILIEDSFNTTIIDNVFEIDKDPTKAYYNLSSHHFQFIVPFVLNIYRSSDTAVIRNTFTGDIGSTVPWIQYLENESTNCLSGNRFVNFAFNATDTNVTSCFRPHLIDFGNEIDGKISPSLMDVIGTFYIESDYNGSSIFELSGTHSYLALDNINISAKNNASLFITEGNVLIVDSYLASDVYLFYAEPSCDVVQNDRLKNDVNYISKLTITCDHTENEDNDTVIFDNQQMMNVMQANVTQFVNHSTATQLEFVSDSPTYYPGQILTFDFALKDRFNTIIETLYDKKMTIVLHNPDLYFVNEIVIDDGECPICTSGLLISAINMDDVSRSYAIRVDLQDENLILINNTTSIDVVACPIGFGTNQYEYQCEPCESGTYNVNDSNVDQCRSCDPVINKGIECIEQSIHVSHNYWMGFEDDVIVSSICPTSYCCSNDHETDCDFIDNKHELCALNRDYTVPLCGSCIEGYSESMMSTNCVKCDRNYNFKYLLRPCVLSLIVTIYLMSSAVVSNKFHSKSKKSNKQNDPNEDRTVNHEIRYLLLKILFAKNIMYYEQAISQILSTSSTDIVFYIVASFFNLSLNTKVGNSSTMNVACFIDGLNAKYKIAMEIYVPAMITICLSILFAISRCTRGKLCKENPLNYPNIFIKMAFIIVGKVLEMLLKLLHCQSVGNKTVHFYFGYEECYGITWIVTLVLLSIVIILFSLPFIQLYRMDPSKRNNKENALETLTYSYKEKCYYWEYVIFIRRIVIALCSVSATDDASRFVFVSVLVLFLFIQHQYEPFVFSQANKVEFILLSFLILVIPGQMLLAAFPILNNVILSILIVFPFVMLFYYVCLFTKNKTNKIRKKSSISKHKKNSSVDKFRNDKYYESDSELKCEKNITVDIEMGKTTEVKKRTSIILTHNPTFRVFNPTL